MATQKDELRIRYLSDGTKPAGAYSNVQNSWLVEQRPHVQPVCVSGVSEPSWINLPWVYYIVTTTQHTTRKMVGAKLEPLLYPHIHRLFFRRTRITTLNGYVLGAVLPNLSVGSYPCYSSKPLDLDASEQECIAVAINSWWAASFNYDYLDYIKDSPAYIFLTKDHSLGLNAMFKHWETLTQEQVMSLPYKKLGHFNGLDRVQNTVISNMLGLSKEVAATKLIDRKIT